MILRTWMARWFWTAAPLIGFLFAAGCRRQPVENPAMEKKDSTISPAPSALFAQEQPSNRVKAPRGGNLQTNQSVSATNRMPPSEVSPAPGTASLGSNPGSTAVTTNDPAALARMKEALDIYNQGVRYFRGDIVPQDYEKAAELFRQAAERGHPAAQHNLGVLFSEGRGVAKDLDKARQWLTKAADAGLPEAQFKLASMYAMGVGTTQDWAQAVSWARKAAEQGHREAQYNLATLYVSGHGVPLDLAEAADWYRKAAEQGQPTAQSNLGVFYASGKGVKQDYAEAMKWLLMAATNGNATAEFNLGRLYADGKGVPPDKVEAYKWLTLAANQGDDEAETVRAELGAQLTPEQMADAIRRATVYMREHAPPTDPPARTNAPPARSNEK